MRDAFGVDREISKGLPSALRGAKGEKMVDRIFDSKAGSKMGRKLEAKYGKKPNLSRKKSRKVASSIERGMGTSNTYLLSRFVRNEAGKSGRPKRVAMAQGFRDWERSAGFRP